MKKVNQIIWLVLLVTVISCNSSTKKLNNNDPDNSLKSSNFKMSEITSTKDSVIPEKKPTYQDIYSGDWKRSEIIGNLKHDPSTNKKDYNYKLKNDGNEVRISYYSVKDRIIRIEKRTYDKTDNELSFSMFDFDENNLCISNTQWNNVEKMSYTYSMYWDSLIKYDVNCKQIELDASQKQQIIQSTKASLDSIMTHFPEFKYSFNWK